MTILDTDIVTLMHAEHPAVARHLAMIGEGDLAITVITIIEIMRGRYDFLMKAATKKQFLHAQDLMRYSAVE